MDLDLAGDLLFESVIDEEFGGSNGTLAGRLRGYNADAAILSEPSSLRICPAQRGGRTVHIKFRSSSGGVLQPNQLSSGVVPQLTHFLASVDDFAAQRSARVHRHEMYARQADPVPVSVTKVFTSPWGFNEPITIPDVGQVELYWQLMPGETQAEVEQEFDEWFRKIVDGAPDVFREYPEVTKPIRWLPGSSVSAAEPLVTELSASAKESWARNLPLRALRVPVTCLCFNKGLEFRRRFLAPAAAIPMLPTNTLRLIPWWQLQRRCWSSLLTGAVPVMHRLLILLACLTLRAQVYSPVLLQEGQPDATDLKRFAQAICTQAHAVTPRERAEAIWRFFLTDGRFVKPGFWYHIAGWTYEEPFGEVLDPLKLLNSYGFGLCYHIAPLLEAVYEAAGFEDARCWFLTGHTVTEVFYEGRYHYFDSDMMGYNVAGVGAYKGKTVTSVRDLERHPEILLAKLAAPDQVRPGTVDEPWYLADVRARAIPDLAWLFTSTQDNYLYPYNRYARGHSMDFVLRPGESLTRFFKPEEPGLYYLPYQFDGKNWKEFPQEIEEYKIRTADGPRSQKDNRLWATGRIDYDAPRIMKAVTVIRMPSPYVIIDAKFVLKAVSSSQSGQLRVETSVDNGDTWIPAGEVNPSNRDEQAIEPKVIAQSEHGRLTAVSGTYGYEVRVTKSEDVKIDKFHLTSRIQVNPRTLPNLIPGENHFVYSARPAVSRVEIGDALPKAKISDMKRIDENGQSFLLPLAGKQGEAMYAVSLNGEPLTGFDIGARFLDIRDGLVPDKLTAEIRHTSISTSAGAASIAWASSANGPFREIWHYDPHLSWLDGDVTDRLLRWPEIFKEVRSLSPGQHEVFIRLRSSGPAIDNIRLALYSRATGAGKLVITQLWAENGRNHRHDESILAGELSHHFALTTGTKIENQTVVFSASR